MILRARFAEINTWSSNRTDRTTQREEIMQAKTVFTERFFKVATDLQTGEVTVSRQVGLTGGSRSGWEVTMSGKLCNPLLACASM